MMFGGLDQANVGFNFLPEVFVEPSRRSILLALDIATVRRRSTIETRRHPPPHSLDKRREPTFGKRRIHVIDCLRFWCRAMVDVSARGSR
jgi:hypothetical protein